MYGYNGAAARQYQNIEVDTGVTSASPERLVLMLLQGAEQRLAAAKGHLERGEVGPRCERVRQTLNIVAELRGSLNHDAGGEIATRLDALYEYMTRRLVTANSQVDAAGLEEVRSLLGEIRSAWEQIMAAKAA
jgi:flagellar protein FliS